jgi:O2-independent ubiquinone biosynthesis accessory factor UbiT
MSNTASSIPRLPRLATALVSPLPLPVLEQVMNRLVRQSARHHPSLFRRLGEHADKCFQIDPIDLPFVFYLKPRADAPQISVHRRAKHAPWDGRIAGPLAALLGMMHGAYDGDALFFSRDIVLEGDTAAVLALRNALDDSELDLFEELTALFGRAGQFMQTGLNPLVALMQKRTGVALRRAEFEA